MTRHCWDTIDDVSVATGWDRPLQHFFLDIRKECPSCGSSIDEDCAVCDGSGEVAVYDNLNDNTLADKMGGMTIDEVRDRLNKYLTSYPQEVFANLLGDKASNIGNQVTYYDTQGQLKAEYGNHFPGQGTIEPTKKES